MLKLISMAVALSAAQPVYAASFDLVPFRPSLPTQAVSQYEQDGFLFSNILGIAPFVQTLRINGETFNPNGLLYGAGQTVILTNLSGQAFTFDQVLWEPNQLTERSTRYTRSIEVVAADGAVYKEVETYTGTGATNGISVFFAAGTSFAGVPLTSVRFSSWSDGVTSLDTVIGNVRVNSVGAVPEPGAWLVMLFGIGVVGYALRSRRTSAAIAC